MPQVIASAIREGISECKFIELLLLILAFCIHPDYKPGQLFLFFSRHATCHSPQIIQQSGTGAGRQRLAWKKEDGTFYR
jgi:hypothetical protein